MSYLFHNFANYNAKNYNKMIGTQEFIIIALVILLLFGGKKIPEMMHGMGKGVKSFKDGMKGIDIDEDDAKDNKKQE